MKQGIFTSNLHHLLVSDTLWFMNGSSCLKTTCPFWKNCVLAVACLADKPRVAWKRRPCCASGAVWDAHLALHDTLAHSLQGPRAWKAALSLFGNATVAGLEPNAISLSSSAASLSYHIFGWFKCLRTCGTSIYRCNVFTVRIVSFLVRFLLSPCQHWYFFNFHTKLSALIIFWCCFRPNTNFRAFEVAWPAFSAMQPNGRKLWSLLAQRSCTWHVCRRGRVLVRICVFRWICVLQWYVVCSLHELIHWWGLEDVFRNRGTTLQVLRSGK